MPCFCHQKAKLGISENIDCLPVINDLLTDLFYQLLSITVKIPSYLQFLDVSSPCQTIVILKNFVALFLRTKQCSSSNGKC